MTTEEAVVLAVNMYGKYHADRRWFDEEKKLYLLEWKGYIFWGDSGTGIWRIYNGELQKTV